MCPPPGSLDPSVAPPPAADDGVDEGMQGLRSEGEEHKEEGGGGGEDGSGSSDEEGGPGRRQQQGGGFLEGGKAASFAKAFAKIVEGSGKRAAEALAAAQQTAAAPAAAAAAPILATSKSIAKRKAEEAEEAKADREAKKLRQEMKQRGHVVRGAGSTRVVDGKRWQGRHALLLCSAWHAVLGMQHPTQPAAFACVCTAAVAVQHPLHAHSGRSAVHICTPAPHAGSQPCVRVAAPSGRRLYSFVFIKGLTRIALPPIPPPAPGQVPKRRGQDPEADTREKGLQRLATKGVVRLFNAIARAQKQLREAEEATGSRAKAVRLGKASFLAQLKGSGAAAAGAKPGEALVPSAPARQSAAAAAPAARQQRRAAAAADSSDDEDAAGWDVLKQGFAGLQGEHSGRCGESMPMLWHPACFTWGPCGRQLCAACAGHATCAAVFAGFRRPAPPALLLPAGGSKMKDWDKQESEEEGVGGDSLADMSGSSDDE